MQKTLIALALLAAAGAASAQSSVTVYGKIDLGLVIDSGASAGKSVRLSSGVTGGSRLGFKGSEDLGDGYKAAFQLETGFCADSAAPVGSPSAFSTSACALRTPKSTLPPSSQSRRAEPTPFALARS